jgi:nitroimidazol reductase NimA-like FMN-containing flavoprotein (pyridoxamine 5'-phosphate oxidase superfamily)
MTIATTPLADRPIFPAEYGIPASQDGLLDWQHIDARLAAATVYWIATASAAGVPHVRPVDGIWLDGRLYVGGSPSTRWVRDLQENPRAAVHLDDGWDVAILEGDARFLADGMDQALAERLAAASNAKYPQYGMRPESYLEAGDGGFVLIPRRAFGWTAFPGDVTRFRFDSGT